VLRAVTGSDFDTFKEVTHGAKAQSGTGFTADGKSDLQSGRLELREGFLLDVTRVPRAVVTQEIRRHGGKLLGVQNVLLNAGSSLVMRDSHLDGLGTASVRTFWSRMTLSVLKRVEELSMPL
jgi:hypothetical protein